MRPQHRITHPRVLHPGAWWLWALGLAAAATRTINPVPLLLLVAVTWFVVTARRGDEPWAASYGLFFKLALAMIAIHVVFQALLSRSNEGLIVLFTLPELPIPDATGLKVGGAVTLEAVLSAAFYGLQLAAIFCCIGAANALGSARRLLRSLPSALYELGIAAVIALTFAPQLVTDARRVRDAARLRGLGTSGSGRLGLRGTARLVMPVLEGALERSVDLAAAMDSRGYGRTTGQPRAARRTTSALVLAGAIGLMAGLYGLLTAHSYGVWLLVAGGLLAVVGLRIGGRRVGRTRYRPDPWAVPEILVAGSGVVAAAATWWTASADPGALLPSSVTELPPVPVVAVLGIMVAALPAFLAPPLPATTRSADRSADRSGAARSATTDGVGTEVSA